MATMILLPLAVRVLIALCTRTFFQPDEYFQALEPAHHLVFGYGHLTWEWVNPQPIRSILYPALNIPVYWILKVLGLDGGWLVTITPKILHGALAAATDIWLCQLTRRTLGERYVSTALLLSLTSFFHALSLSRSLSNSLETSLTTIAFSYYPWDASVNLSSQLIYNRSRVRKMILFAALACMVRATNAVIWVYLFGNLFWALRLRGRLLISVVFDAMFAGVLAISFLFALDSIYYGKPTFTPISFLYTNLSGVSLFYGGKPWHYYVSQAIPILCTTSLPFVVHGIRSVFVQRGNDALKTMLGVMTWTIGAYSLAGHKEWRFIHPLLPLMHLLATKSLVDMYKPEKRRTLKDKRPLSKPPSSLPIRRSHLFLLLSVIPVSVYTTLFYCSAPISVMSYIRHLPSQELREHVGVLMPCHSIPGHAYLHREELARGGMWALGCEPPLLRQDLATYQDQTTLFYASPSQYLTHRFPSAVNTSFPPSPFPASIPGALEGLTLKYPWVHEWPRNLILFGALLEQKGVQRIIEERGYQEMWRGGRDWEGDGDERKGGVRVWKFVSPEM